MKSLEDVFDYVIIGAGSAGCVLANRLSADPSVRVALVEAGGRDNWHWIHIPAGTRNVVGNPRTDWCFETEVEPMLGRKGPVFRGKVLGGSSSINGTVYTRGTAKDYDNWRQLGLAGWGWDDVQPHFQSIERFVDGGDEVRGKDGELCIEPPRLSMPIFEIFSTAAEQAGLQKLASFNRGECEGFGYFDVTQRRGRRWSSAKAFLDPVRSRKNLIIFTDAHCTGLVFDGDCVAGARVSINGTERLLTARREVILAAGAIGTPQILMLSGIGPGQVLQDAGVPVRLERSMVGENLQDHLSMRLAWRVYGTETVNTRYHNLFKRAMIGAEYAFRRTGPLIMGAPLWGGFLRSDASQAVPNLQFLAMPASVTSETSFSEPDRFDGVSCGIYNMHPRSRGRVRIVTPNPLSSPSILHNYLSDPEDQKVAIKSIQLMRHLFSQPAFAALRPEELRPGHDALSDEQLLEEGKRYCGTAYHQVGTCAMGTGDESVVDDRLRVRGVQGLRIADGSVLPTLISGNTNACIMMIADKAAAMIRVEANNLA